VSVAASIPDSHREILEAPGVGVLTTLGRDGAPQSTAVWYLLDGDAVVTSLDIERQKSKNLERDPRFSLLVPQADNPYRTIELRGRATLEVDDGRRTFEQIVRHYGMDPATFPDDKSRDRVKMTLVPDRVLTFGG
jgi:PPOX class probable F420-dependent enzyme